MSIDLCFPQSMVIMSIVVLLLWETAAAPKVLSSILLSSNPLIYQLPQAVVSWAPRLVLF